MSNFRHTFAEPLWAIMPMAVFIVILKVTFFEVTLDGLLHLIAGTAMTVLGLVLFLAGARVGILPVGERLGSRLPRLNSLAYLFLFVLFLGFAATVAEPDVRVAAQQIADAADGYVTRDQLILSTAIGLGSFLVIAMARMLGNRPLSWFLTGGYGLVALLALVAPPEVFAIAFDLGGVTTGPLTLPLVLALNMGLASVLGGRSTVEYSFGTVALASIGSIITVLLLGIAIQMGVL